MFDQRWGWGREEMVDPKTLTIPEDYQRDETIVTADIEAAGINPLWFGRPIVSSTSRHVIDGGSRVRGAIALGINPIPCLMFDNLTLQEEATDFLGMNKHRKPVNIAATQRTECFIREPVAMLADRVIREVDRPKPPIRPYRLAAKKYPDELQRIVPLLRELFPADRAIPEGFLAGLIYLEHRRGDLTIEGSPAHERIFEISINAAVTGFKEWRSRAMRRRLSIPAGWVAKAEGLLFAMNYTQEGERWEPVFPVLTFDAPKKKRGRINLPDQPSIPATA